MFKQFSIGLCATALLLWAVGCSDNPTVPEPVDSPDFTEEFGGYTASPEAPGFGDSELIASENDEEEIDDALLGTPAVDSLVACPRARQFHFRAVWGQLRYDSAVTEVTDWSGSLTVSHGAIIVRRLIRFELNQDYLLPRTDRKLAEWLSYTTVHNDGIAVDLYLPPLWPVLDSTVLVDAEGDTTVIVDTIPVEPVTLTFETGPYSRTFTLDELAALDTVVFLDDPDSNAVAFHAYQMFRNVCPRGILAGRWGYDENGNGVFLGTWRSRFGLVTGYLKGHWGTRVHGRKVFFGKWIDRAGNFEGFLKGHWDVVATDAANARAIGWFDGRIYNAAKQAIGVLKGRFGSARFFPAGWFQGRWKLFCAITPAQGNKNELLDDGF